MHNRHAAQTSDAGRHKQMFRHELKDPNMPVHESAQGVLSFILATHLQQADAH